ncbi:MAG: hypothetical protein ACLFR0_01955 [Alphaproteobacteria bacterium]
MSQDDQDAHLFPASPGNTHSTAVSQIDENFKDRAMDQICAVFKGNGIKQSNIKCEHFDGATLEFLATTTLKFRFKVLEHVEAGKKPGPKQINGKGQLEEEKAKLEHKITHRADVAKQIQSYIVENREDMGYGVDGQMIKLPFLYTRFVQYEGCQNCRAQGRVQCQRCHGQGMEMCQRCHGQGLEMCPGCNGAQTIQGPNGNQQCQRCMGRGKISCSLCNERRKIQCRVCKTKGTTQCGVCNGHAWNSHLYDLEIDAMPSFDYDREKVEERIGTIIEDLGPKLVEHAHIHPIFKERDEKKAEDKRDYITIPYLVKLPYGGIRFSIGDGEKYNTLIFGNNCTLFYMPFLLDRILKKPLARLKEAAENRGDVAAKVKAAAKFRTLRHAILAAAKLPLGKAMKKVKLANPHAIQNETIQAAVNNADKALKNITRKPRQHGFILGCILMTLIFGGYLPGGGRSILAGELKQPLILLALDGLVIIAGFYCALLTVKFMARKAISQALSGIVPKNKEKSFTPKAGKIIDRLLIATPVLFLIMLEASYQIQHAPDWYENFRGMIGI